eukprot:1153195-Pelagomonas_calceolata.AAC.8
MRLFHRLPYPGCSAERFPCMRQVLYQVLINTSTLQHHHSCLAGTTNWPVLRECGQEPLQFYWFSVSVNFLNNMLVSNSETLCQVLKADLHFADMDESCWSAHVSKSFSGMRKEEVFRQKLLSASKIPMQGFLGDLRHRQQKVWREADALSPQEVNRTAVT